MHRHMTTNQGAAPQAARTTDVMTSDSARAMAHRSEADAEDEAVASECVAGMFAQRSSFCSMKKPATATS